MSLITSCPACGTMFRVVADQLKISEGWVRCGHCTEVFDATAHMADEEPMSRFPPDAELAAPPDVPPREMAAWGSTRPADLSSRPGGLPSGPSELATQPAGLETDSASAAPPARTPPAPRNVESKFRESRPRPEEAPAARAAPESTLEPSDLDAPFVFRRSDLMEPDPVPSVLPAMPQGSDSRYPSDDPAGWEYEDVSFVRQARRKAFWRRPMVRVVLAFTSLLLAAALLLQVAYDDRDRVAMLQPRLRPALELMCEHLLCTLGPPRQIESVVIESSGFNRLRNDTYRLSFTLRNSAPITVAAPAMELTLTDTQDQPVLRRVLTPAELGARDNVIAAGSEWSGTIGLALNAGNGRIAGYRLLAFYP